MKYICLLSLMLLAGCGASGFGSTSSGLPPVSAQSNYSNASITGTYSVNISVLNNGYLFTDLGTLSLDGNGHITSGNVTIDNGSLSCTASVTGTYNLQSNASGTATVALTASNPGCAGPASIQLSVEAAQQGETVMFAETDGQQVLSGTAVKQ